MGNKFLKLLVMVAVILGIGTKMMTTKIPVGYVGMVYSTNGIEKEALQQGWHLVAPWKKIVNYNISLEQAFLSKDKREGSREDESFDIPSKDGKMINVDVEFSYKFNEEKIVEIYKTFRGKDVETIKETFMRAKIKAWTSEISSKYQVIDIYGDGRTKLNKEVFDCLKEKFSAYGIEIESANFSRIKVDSGTETAIQDNINKKQDLVKKEIETEIAKKVAEREKVEIDLANYKSVSNAKAEAEANSARNKTITPEMIELEKIRKWDGKLPTYQGNGSSIINLK